MGSRMVKRLLDAGHAVTGYNRTRSKAEWLIESGMRWADTPRAVAESSDVVLTMVTDTAAMAAVTAGPDGLLAGLSPGKVHVDMSSISPAASRELATKVEATGARMLDAPVSGSVSTLEEGKLSIMVGGDPSTLERVLLILRDIGPTVTHVGGNGQAVAMKIATNLSLAVQILAFSEGVLLAERSGIDRETAVHVLLNSVIASPMLKYRGPFVLAQPDEAWFDREHDAEGPADGAGDGTAAGRPAADHRDRQRAPHRGPWPRLREEGLRRAVRGPGDDGRPRVVTAR